MTARTLPPRLPGLIASKSLDLCDLVLLLNHVGCFLRDQDAELDAGAFVARMSAGDDVKAVA